MVIDYAYAAAGSELHEGVRGGVEVADVLGELLGSLGACRSDLNAEPLVLEVVLGLELVLVSLADDDGDVGEMIGAGEVDLLLPLLGDVEA